jgi:DNA-directed RNA polymerase subunit H (RpoH/RPB5)
MAGSLHRKYLNIQIFIEQYRKFICPEPFLDRKQFKKNMQLEQYVKINCRNPKTGRPVYIYLMHSDSKYVNSTPNFKKLMDALGDNVADVIVITKAPLSIYINKVLHTFATLKIINYLHRHFSIEITKGPLCSTHTILSNEEVIKTCFQDLMIHPLSIPPIFITDPICLWIGAEIGQVVKIESYSENSGLAIRYRIVSPKVGRIPISKTPKINPHEKKEPDSKDESEPQKDEGDDDEEKESADEAPEIYDINDEEEIISEDDSDEE